MEVFRWNLYRIVEEMRPMTVRQVFYQAVVRGYVEKLESEVDRVGANLVLMRKASYDDEVANKIGDAPAMPLDWIVDLGRRARAAYTLDGVEDAIRDAAETYRKKLWEGIDEYVEIWVEKDGQTGIIQPVTNRYDVRLMSARGYASLSLIHAAAQNIIAVGKPTFIYHFGDFDPSGVGAGENIEEVLRQMLDADGSFFEDLTFERIAVTLEQIREWNLPTRPTKKTDTRATGFGEISVELDAVEPQRLRDLVQEVIERHLDPDTYTDLMEEEVAEKAKLLELVDARIWE
jgi:AcrR family transcriptional regulator